MKFYIFCLTWLLSFSGFAHTDQTLDSMPSPHGGQVRMAGAYHFELVVAESKLTVYVTDHAGNSVSTSGASGDAIVLVKNIKTTVPLQPTGENMLQGEGKFSTDSQMKVVLSITLSGKETQQARFTPLQK